MSNTEQQLIETATELGRLKERQHALASRIQYLEYQLKVLVTANSSKQKASPLKPAQLPLPDSSKTDQIVRYLNANPDRSFKTAALMKAVPGINATTLRTTLYRLEKSGRVAKSGRGRYRAVAHSTVKVPTAAK